MEPFENDTFPPLDPENLNPIQEPVPSQPEPEPTVCYSAGRGRKESPFADSPYVMQQPREEYRYQPQTEPPAKPKKAKKQRKPVWKPLLAALLVVALVAGSCLITAYSINDYWEDRSEDTVDMLLDRIDDLESQISKSNAAVITGPLAEDQTLTPGQLYNRCVNSVVAISSTVQTSGFYGSTGKSSGSGFILTDDGYVVTNYHVVENATNITVVMHDGSKYPAKLVGHDASTNDLAVLKIEATGLTAAAIGSSSDLAIGDMVAAIGNPLGMLTSTQTVGYVSGIGREVATDSLTTISMIQTDAAINPGNSGGPLFNMRGEVIGITTAKYSGTTGSGATIEGIGFAIPIDDVMNVIDDLIDYGYVNSAYMGVTVTNTNESAASMYGLPTGAYIASVDAGGAAERAGIRVGDIVITLGDQNVSNVTDLTRALRGYKAGDTTTVTVLRGGQELVLEITLDAKPQQTTQTEPQPDSNMPEGNYDDWYDYFRRYFGN